MLIARADRWQQLPQHPVEIDRAHPIGAKIACAQVGGIPIDLAKRAPLTVGSAGAQIVATPEGRAWNFTNSVNSYVEYPVGTDVQPGAGVSIVALFRYLGTGGIPVALGRSNTGDHNTYINVDAANNRIGFRFRTTADMTGATVYGANGALTAGRTYLAAVSDVATNSRRLRCAGVTVANTDTLGAYVLASTTRMRLGVEADSTPSLPFNGPVLMGLLARPYLTEAEVDALGENPWQIFRPRSRRIWVPVGGGGAVDLTIAAAHHAHTTDAPTLTQAHVLAVANCLHAHAADAPSLAQTHILAIANALHAHAADGVTLNVGGIALTVADAAHAHAAGPVDLSQGHVLVVSDAAHAHGADAMTLVQQHVLAVADALHTHGAQGVTVTVGGITLAVADAAHAHAAGEPALAQQHVLVISSALHAHLADALGLQLPGGLPPEHRILVLRAEHRVLIVAPENRTLTLH